VSVKVHIFHNLKHLTNGVDAVEVEGSTVGECLNHLVKQFPGAKKGLLQESGEKIDFLEIYINRESAYPNELSTPVKDGDEIQLTYLIGGG